MSETLHVNSTIFTRSPVRLAWYQRIAPVVALLFLAPWVGEYLLGNISIRDLAAIPFLAPLYGGGAVLIREVTRRSGRGWPTMIVLAAAYGVIEAGLVDQSLFNASFEGHSFQQVARIPALGFSLYDALAFIGGHVIWSISIPIALVELWTPQRRTTPWLGKVGLGVIGLLYLLGCWIIFADLQESQQFMATPGQLTGAALVALVFIVGAFTLKQRPAIVSNRPVPAPWLVGVSAFVLSSAYFARPESWLGVWMGVGLLTVAWVVVAHWARQQSWGIRHQVALVAGTLLTYAWGGFALTALFQPEDGVRWLGNMIFAVFAIVLLVVTARRTRHQ